MSTKSGEDPAAIAPPLNRSQTHGMPDVSTHHQPDLAHHVRQAVAWLAASAEGENTAALSYAAFELRFAVERLAIHYWAALLDRKVEEQDLRDIESFKRVERRIYELGGHQLEIDGHFAFMRVVLGAMKIGMPFHTPKIGGSIEVLARVQRALSYCMAVVLHGARSPEDCVHRPH